MNPQEETANTWNKIASVYQERFMDLAIYNHTYDEFCNAITSTHPRILEIGCGPGNITKYLLSQLPNMFLHGIDIAPNMIDLAKKNNPNASFSIMDCREIHQLTDTYDGIMCGFCFPYLSKEEAIQLIENAAAILNSNGLLYISTMEDDYNKSGVQTSSNGEDKIFMYYHQEDYLKATLLQNNFTILDTKHQSFPTQDGSTVTDMIIIGRLKS